MGTGGDIVSVVVPSFLKSSEGELFYIIDIEYAFVQINTPTHAFGIKGDIAVFFENMCNFNGRGGTCHTCVAALDAAGAGVARFALKYKYRPRVVFIICERCGNRPVLEIIRRYDLRVRCHRQAERKKQKA